MPNVITARNVPESRNDGIATSAPTGSATNTASPTPTSHGRPAASACPSVTAPTAANAMWHNEIWPDVHSSRPIDAKMMKNPAASV